MYESRDFYSSSCVARSEILLSLCKSIAQDRSHENLLDRLLDAAMSTSGSEKGMVVAYSQDGKLMSHVERHLPSFVDITLDPVVKMIIESVGISGARLVVKNIAEDQRFIPSAKEVRPRTILCFPVWGNNHTTAGAFYLEQPAVLQVPDETLVFLDIIASLMSIGIAHLFGSQDQFRKIYDYVDTGMILLDHNGIVLSANSSVRTIFQVEPVVFLNRSVHALLGSRVDELDGAIQIALRSGSRSLCHFIVNSRINRKLIIEAKVTPLPEWNGKFTYLVTFEDRTEHQAMLDSIVQRDKMASIGLLAAGVAHEFNNIWSAVQGYAELAKIDSRFLPELVDVALEQAERASGIVKGLLSFSDKRNESRAGIRLDELIRSMMKLVSLELKAKNIKTTLTLSPDVFVDGCQGQLQLVLLNLVMNAAHAIGNQGEIKIGLEQDNTSARITISDNGCGMNEDELACIFNPFYTTKGAFGGSAEEDGHGLGLTLSYNLIQAHHGRIDVCSRKGEGSTFTLTLPRGAARASDSGEESPVLTPEPAKGGAKSYRILLVEDEVMLHALLGSILHRHQMTSVVSGREALKKLEEESYDAVLLDLVLEDEISGFDVFDLLPVISPETRVIFLTGRIEDRRSQEYLSRAAAVIRKPFSVNEIHIALRKAFAEDAAHL